jgi:hypothetical protein
MVDVGKRDALKADLLLYDKEKADFKICTLLITTVSAIRQRLTGITYFF